MDVNLTVEKLFPLLLERFRSQWNAKVKEYLEPEFIKLRVGRWRGWREGSSPCEVKVNLEPRKTEMTRIVFRFDFSKVYTVTLVSAAIGLILVGIFFGLDTAAFCIIPLIAAFLSIPRSTSKAKKKFMSGLRSFLRENNVLLPSKCGK